MRYVLLAALILVADSNKIPPIIDNGKLTCRDFMASGQSNMAALINWLLGYHSGKTGTVPYSSEAVSHYGTKIGSYCKSHPMANLLETSEHVLDEIDRGI
jgi:hypothetical protein